MYGGWVSSRARFTHRFPPVRMPPLTRRGLLASALVAAPASRATAADERLECLAARDRLDANLASRLKAEALAALERRAALINGLKSPEQIRGRARELREFFTRQLGGFPERTPLESQTTRRLDGDGFRIECVTFASRPGHTITANLYLPRARGRVPGVAVSSGHSRTGKTADYNQRFGIALARHGMAALCFDPIGQGERSQILKPDGQPQYPSTTTEHFLMGAGAVLVGRNTAAYRVWDAMRAIDYLCSRREIDPQRIGMTGCSGGGTLTSYVMALDDRVACAAPACYLTTFRRLLETIGPQDAEQNIFGQLAFGMDHADYLLMRAPKPTLISSTTADFFDISGSWDCYREAKRLYAQLGHPERVDLVELEGSHGVQPGNLAAIVQWMRRWLLESDEPVPVVEYPVRPPEELLCTPSGQVLRLEGERSVFQLNAERGVQLAAARRTEDGDLRARVRSALQVGALPAGAPQWQDVGRVFRQGYHIDRLILRNAAGAPLPGLTFHPPQPGNEAYLYLHPDGKLADGAAGGPIEKLVRAGYAVVALDLSGLGETGPERRDPLLGDWKTASMAYLLGRPLLGTWVLDALTGARFVAHYKLPEGRRRPVHAVGVGGAGLALLHAAALEPDLFASVTLRACPRDWQSTLASPPFSRALETVVHGALAFYDLPDLVRLAGPARVRYED